MTPWSVSPSAGWPNCGGALGERLDLARAVEQRVLGVDVEMGAGRGAHCHWMLGARAAEAQRPRRCLRHKRMRPISDRLCLCEGRCGANASARSGACGTGAGGA